MAKYTWNFASPLFLSQFSPSPLYYFVLWILRASGLFHERYSWWELWHPRTANDWIVRRCHWFHLHIHWPASGISEQRYIGLPVLAFNYSDIVLIKPFFSKSSKRNTQMAWYIRIFSKTKSLFCLAVKKHFFHFLTKYLKRKTQLCIWQFELRLRGIKPHRDPDTPAPRIMYWAQ